MPFQVSVRLKRFIASPIPGEGWAWKGQGRKELLAADHNSRNCTPFVAA